MEIRMAENRDIPGLMALLRQVGEVHHQGRPDIFRAGAQKYDAAKLEAMLACPATPVFAAVENSMVLGYGMCQHIVHRDEPVMADFSTLYIDDLCVDENCRGRHIGTALYDCILSYAKGLGCRSVTLNVWCCNKSAMAFYRARGLQPQKIGMETILEDD